jgi:ACS family glucarate transporter-like MFS transporter
VLGLIGICAFFAWLWYMKEPRQHPHVSRQELDYIIDGGGLIDIDSTAVRKDKNRLSRATFRKLLTNRMLWCAYIGQYCTIALSYFFITWFCTPGLPPSHRRCSALPAVFLAASFPIT